MRPTGPVALGAEQAAAAHAAPSGAWLVAAGPGTGKTFTIVERFTWLVEEHGADPASILAVTFTDAAAAELRERIAAELARRGRTAEAADLDSGWIGTFHGTCARLLRDHAYLVGMPRERRVLDEVDQRLLLRSLQARLRSGTGGDLDLDAIEQLTPDEVADLVKDGLRFALRLKGRGITPEAFRGRALEMHAGLGLENLAHIRAEREAIGVLAGIYRAYQAALLASHRMDFDDLVLATVQALEEVPEFRELCRARFHHILVDEFQDTNRIQLELIRLLAAPGFANVTVVGDAKQSIYGWRDADIDNIRRRFPGRPLPLTRNRRSFQEILDLATGFIRLDPEFEREPDLVAERGTAPAAPITLLMAADTDGEARLVAGEVRRAVESGVPPARIAVLAASVRRLPRQFEQALRDAGVPYVTSAGSGFFDREEVKDVLALLRVVADPMDDAALARVLQGPVVRAGDGAVYRLAARRLGRRGVRLRDCFDEALAEGLPELPGAVGKRARHAVEVTDALGARRDALTVADVLNRLLEDTGYLRHAQLRAGREGPRALLNLRKVFRMANRFEQVEALGGLPEFVRHLDEVMEAEIDVAEAEQEAPEAVRLMTVHASKGLEFDHVFLVDVRPPRATDAERLVYDPEGHGFVMRYWHQGTMPRWKALAPAAEALRRQLEERRRTVFVAITRARDRVWISATRTEASPAEVEPGENDHFGELVRWALNHPDAARIVGSEQLHLDVGAQPARPAAAGPGRAAAVLDRLELLAAPPGPPAPLREPAPLQLSFSQLHDFRVCPVRYRFREVWKVPAPPDELLPRAAAAAGSSELGSAVHEALAAWHARGGDILAGYSGPDAGARMLERYAGSELAAAPTLGCEAEFNLYLAVDGLPGAGVRLRGFVDRVCTVEGRTALVDYKTNSRLEPALVAAYATQLRLYALASAAGLLPGGSAEDPLLLLHDLRRGVSIPVDPDAAAVRAEVAGTALRLAAGDFGLGPEHAERPCAICAYAPICPSRR